MKKLGSAVLLVLLSPLLLVVGLVCLVCYPFWLFSYKRSAWYKDRGEKYMWGINSALYYKIHNLAAKNDLPLKHEQIGTYHLFSYGNRLLFPISDYTDAPEYDEQLGCFTVKEQNEEEKESCSLAEYLARVENELGDALQGRKIFPILSDIDLGDHLKQADGVFYVYADKKDLVDLLAYFCSNGDSSAPFVEEN